MKPRFVPRAELPERVRQVQPPVDGLWVLGRDLDELQPRVGIVGARNANDYGVEVARNLAAGLAAFGICVVSGMARGIDTAAHRGAVSVEGPTIAVLAGGADRPYPASSRDIYDDIIDLGAVVSEEQPGADHRRENFVKRNRIIAGLCDALVLVQAVPPKSGALTTVEMAEELGVDILAVPGDLRAALSNGPHDLLRDGAKLCISAEDVLVALGMMHREKGERTPPLPIPDNVEGDDRAILVAVTEGSTRMEEIRRRCELDARALARALSTLELRGLLVRDMLGRYARPR